jgi:hypothetical protein
MDKITFYQSSLCELLLEYKHHLGGGRLNKTDDRLKIITDKEHNQFQLLIAGWNNGKYSFKVLFHFEIYNDKIWLQENNTEFYVADELIEKGVAREDIVLGFLPERDRAFSGFATA